MATKVSKKKLKDYFQDKKNFNRGTEFGEGLIEKSVSRFGAGRSMLASSDGVLIAGNKSHQKLAEAGIENVIEVETDGKTAVVVKRTDIKSGTKKFHELALADNATSRANLNFDEQLVEEILTEEVMQEWGIEKIIFPDSFTLPDGDRAPFQQMTFTVADAQAETIKKALNEVIVKDGTQYGNENSHGNQLHQIILEWAEQRV